MSLAAGQNTSLILNPGQKLTVTLTSGSALIRRFANGVEVDGQRISASKVYGPYLNDYLFKIDCLTGSVDVLQSEHSGAANVELQTDASGNVTLVGPDGDKFGMEQVLLQSASPVTVTGTVNSVIAAKKTIQGGTLQPGDCLIVRFLGSNNNNANNKTFSVRIGGQQVFESATTTNTTQHQELNYYVRSGTEIRGPNQYGGPGYGNGYAGSVIVNPPNINFSNDTAVDIRMQLANAADTMTLEGFCIAIRRGAGVNEA